MHWTYDNWTLSFMKYFCNFLVYKYFMWFIICDLVLLIFGNMLMNLDVLHNKLNLDKPPIIQKYCCYKMPNQNILFFLFCVTLGSTIKWECSIWILGFKKKLVREIEVNKLDKISLIGTFVLFFKKNCKYWIQFKFYFKIIFVL
jgi:hypothetical protein